jgi:hypothetical protein
MYFRNIITNSDSIALGCSHTWGVGVEANETWSYKLNAKNFGVGGCSADLIVRIAPDIFEKQQPTTVYVLWPDWRRFEYVNNGKYCQSLPTDSNRIYFMETHTEEWLINNFSTNTKKMRELCENKNIKLVDMTLYDLIPYIDHADTWPISKLGHHYAPEWHTKVADIFRNATQNNIQHPLSNT